MNGGFREVWERAKALVFHKFGLQESKRPKMPQRKLFQSFEIYLPADHKLTKYQTQHPNYDRFLPHLAKYLDNLDLVVDVGANVGDTLAAMYEANPNLRYICVEPDDEFYIFLSENIARIKSAGNRIEVETYQALVGHAVSHASLHGVGGTKHAVPGQGVPSVPLDALIRKADRASVRLLKTDVDGYDFDVLDSARTLISLSKPLIYFEAQYETKAQLNGYLATLASLEARGYSNWSVFDNFGSLMLQTSNLSHLSQLMSYIWVQNIEKSTRTIYYLDVLAARDEDRVFVEKVLETY